MSWHLTAMLSAISQLGMQTLLVREISRDKDRVSSYVSSSLLIGAFSSIIMLVVSNIAVMAIEKDQDLRLYIGLLTLGFTLSYVTNTLTAGVLAFEKMRPVLIQRTAWNIIRIGGTIGFLLAGTDAFCGCNVVDVHLYFDAPRYLSVYETYRLPQAARRTLYNT